ncbi:MAG: DUF222 domain-containing protein [Dermatophilaceae bacterium]
MVAALHETNPHPGASWTHALNTIHHTLDEISHHADPPPNTEHATLIRQIERAQRRLDGLTLLLTASARAAGVARDAGYSDTGAWLADTTHTNPRPALATVKLADSLQRRLPHTRAALIAGDLSREHAAVIEHVTRTLPRGLTDHQRARIETDLINQATTMDPARLRQTGRRALAVVEPDEPIVDAHQDEVLRSEEQHAYDRARFTLRDNGDGTTTGHFTIPNLAGSILTRILDAMASPRRANYGAHHAQAGDTHGRDGTDPWTRRMGQAFTELIEHAPTDHLSNKAAATVVITLDLDRLRNQLKAAAVDTGEAISAATARRLACQAGLIPAVLGGRSQPLDLGRSARLFTETQRKALATRHTTCAAHGCQRPYTWTELHHRHPWAHGGTTNLTDAIPLCSFHHRRIHDPTYHHQETTTDTGLPTITFHRRQ